MIEQRPATDATRDDADPPAALPPLVIRRMRGTDIEHVSRVERRSFPTSWSTQAYVTEIANPSACYLVALVSDALVGYGGTWVIMDEAHITTLGVDPVARGQKIGECLLGELLLAGQRLGATRATLEVRRSNTAARRLYEKYGFTAAGERRGYYSDNGEDAIIMWINDMTAPAWRQQFHNLRAALDLGD